MPTRSSKPKRPRDISQLALTVVAEATGSELPPAMKRAERPEREKNPAAVALGKLGGAKGGVARAAKLSPARRRAIARKAAKTRWGTE